MPQYNYERYKRDENIGVKRPAGFVDEDIEVYFAEEHQGKAQSAPLFVMPEPHK
jgi:hypothetical protein